MCMELLQVKIKIISILFALVLIIASGCSGNGSENPVAPEAYTHGSSALAGDSHLLWGMWQVAIDTSNGDVEIVPCREGTFHANVVQYLQPPFQIGMGIVINDMNMETGVFDIDVSLTHPFPDPSLKGFDVKGIFITNGIMYSWYDSSLVYADYILNPRLLNADGYTRWWNPIEFDQPGVLGYTEGVLGTKFVNFTSTLNPFKYFADHLEVEDEFYIEPGGRNLFSESVTNTRKYMIQFPVVAGNPLVVFNYAVDANWEAPQGDPEDLASFGPDANQPEPYQITVADNGTSAFYDEGSGLLGGDVKILLGISDYGFSTPSSVAEELETIIVESFTLTTAITEINPADFSYFDGRSAIYEVDIPGVEPEAAYNQELLIHAVTSDLTYDQGYGTPAPDEPLASFYLYDVPVLDGLPSPSTPVINDVSITRDIAGRLTGFIIDWDDDPEAYEYRVYWSEDPYEVDGSLTFDLAPNGVVDESSYSYSVTGAEVNGQWMFRVISRGIQDNPDSDSDPSADILVDFEAFEAYVEGQNEWRRRYNRIRNHFLAATGPAYGVGTSGALIMVPSSTFYRNSTCYVVCPTLPELPDKSRCFIEFAHNRTVDFPPEYGYSVCTSPTIQDPEVIDQWFKHAMGPAYDYLVIYDYNIDVIPESDYLWGEQMNDLEIEGLGWSYNMNPSESSDPINGWANEASTGFEFSRFEASNITDNYHSYVGICFAGEGDLSEPPSYPIFPSQYPLIIDEIAMVIF